MYIDEYGDGSIATHRSSETRVQTSCDGRGAEASVFAAPVDWAARAADRLIELIRLPVGWDGHRGRPLAKLTAEFTCSLLARIMGPGVPLPAMMPASYGGLQLEWHRKGWDVEIEVMGPNHVQAYARDIHTGDERELSVTTDFSGLLPLIDKIRD
jgi:hypothetical protein